MDNSSDYALFLKFIKTYESAGFKGIDRNDPLILEIESMMERHNQFFYVADLIKLSFLFTSKRSKEMMGVEPDDLNFYHFYTATHPEEVKRNGLGRATLLKLANELFEKENGYKLISSSFRIRNAAGTYSHFLIQMYLFFSNMPVKTVYMLKVHTNIDWCRDTKECYHYYLGENLDNFRLPDKEMLKLGKVFSEREFEIIKMIVKGYSSAQIAEKLFLSPHTVNTHRRNILHKTGMSHISDLVYDLMERGVI